jgi:hypothetical protein
MAAIGMALADLILEWIDKKGKRLNEILDSRKDIIYFSDGSWKERIPINEKRHDYTL